MYNHEQEISDSDSEFSEDELEVDEESDPQNNLSVILAVNTVRNRGQSRGRPRGSRANRGGRSSQQISLPNPQEFIFLQHRLPFRERGYPILPGHLQQLEIVTPLIIGVCGTVRTNSAKFSKELKIQNLKSFKWDTLSGIVVNNMLAVLWIDNGP
ncbi:22098_t:CDS:2, partial [Racocetra persica]